MLKRIEAYKVLIILLCSFCYQAAHTRPCESVAVCVRSGSIGNCHSTVDRTITELSHVNVSERSCASAEIILTGGIHLLTKDLDFSNSKLTIHSFSMATVMCKNTAITFEKKQSKVNISNITFHGCNKVRNVKWGRDLAVTLYFYNVSYMIKNLVISNTSGIGLYALNCKKQIVQSCMFHNNTMGNARIQFWHYQQNSSVSVLIFNTTFSFGSSETGGGLQVNIYDKVQCDMRIENATFCRNRAISGSHFIMKTVEDKPQNSLPIYLSILNSQFVEATGCHTYGAIVNSSRINRIRVTIDESAFKNNSCGALLFIDNKKKRQEMEAEPFRSISNSIFQNNSRAIYLSCKNFEYQQINITNCMFTAHNLTKSVERQENIAALQIDGCKDTGNDHVIIERSYFKRNFGDQEDHSSLYFRNLGSAMLLGVVVEDNNCTGIFLRGSRLSIQDTVTITTNSAIFGGGITMKSSGSADKGKNFSSIALKKDAFLNITYNKASTYGGGIFTDQSCEEEFMACPIIFQSKQLHFEGNRAGIGGDIISGGCLSNCRNDTHLIGKLSHFLRAISSTNEQSQSTCAEYPRRVAFCENVTSTSANCSIATKQVSAYPGQVFEVSLMVVDDSCIPSKGIIQAKTEAENGLPIHLGNDHEVMIFKQSKKYCSKFSYSVTNRMPGTSAYVEFSYQWQSPTKSQPTLLQVNLVECPKGFKYAKARGQCDCSNALEAIRVECAATDHSLKVPPRVWIGEYNNKVAINQYCQHCNNSKRKTIYPLNTTNNSDVLCMKNRTGILCGRCTPGYSLQLGGYRCDKCTGSTFTGVLLVIFFLLSGFGLIVMLLSLNLTVSTGVINALVFYSNMVYSNADSFLPNDMELEKPWLHGIVNFLSVFQAWINLDFGITACFFEGYDLYDSTWLQFLFPLYIWFLVLLIVLASKYSSRISKLTSSSTVPVLATLLLLSYTKLLLASISAVSFTSLHFLDDSSRHVVWFLDGSIAYLHDKHIPLFVTSLLWILGFILPFTLLILLGPMLQAKSQYKFLNWINKLKPLLDAFYGPYTDKYRYWPGLLLLARLLLSLIAAFYSLGDGPYKLLVLTVTVAILLTLWILLVRSHSVQPYYQMALNYLEIFFLLDLAIFSIVSVYFQFTKENNHHRQVLAVVMVGATFLVFCSILIYQILQKLSKYKVTKKFIRYIPYRRMSKLFEVATKREHDIDNSDTVSYTTTEVSGYVTTTQSTVTTSSVEIREPLLYTS